MLGCGESDSASETLGDIQDAAGIPDEDTPITEETPPQDITHGISFNSFGLKYGVAVPKGNSWEIRFADKDNVDFYYYCQTSPVDPTGSWAYYKEINVGITIDLLSNGQQNLIDSSIGKAYVLGGSGRYGVRPINEGSYQVIEDTDVLLKGKISSDELSGEFVAYKCTAEATKIRLSQASWAQKELFSLTSEYNRKNQGKLEFWVNGPVLSERNNLSLSLKHTDRPSFPMERDHKYDSESLYTSFDLQLIGNKLYASGCERKPIGEFSETSVKFSIRDCDPYEKSIGAVEIDHVGGKNSIRFLYNNVGVDKYIKGR